jgi:ATP-dependent RNA helicase DeaD
MPFPPVHPSLLRALSERGYTEPTPVQAAVLQPEAAGRDLIVSAQTGSGKTVAYGLAIAPTLLGDLDRLESRSDPLALVVAPTRELALQVHQELSWLYAYTGARIVSCVGGMDIRREQRALAQGAHIVVGTPGRLRDHVEHDHLETAQLRAVVLDEADEMLDLGFREDLQFILDATPPERRTLLFSATIPKGIAALAKRYQRDAVRIASSAADEPHGDIEYRAIQIAPNDVEHAVVNILRYFEVRGALVFCATREAVRHLHGNLLERGFAVVALSGELSQAERIRALQALRDGRARVCVATDVAARGLDLPDLGLVVHSDLPHDREVLLHRSGRTGRAGRKGICVLLVPYTRRRYIERLLATAHIDAAWSAAPSADEIRSRDQDRLVSEAMEAANDPSEEDLAAARVLLSQRSPEDLAAALIRLQRSRLPAPEDLFDGPAPPARAPDGPRAGPQDTVWFRVNVGRTGNADPRWLLPFLCRHGHVTRRDVGRIRVMDRETQFEIARHAAARFASAVRHPPEGKDGEIRIEALQPRARAGEEPRRRVAAKRHS